MRIHLLIAALLLSTSALALTACGGDPSTNGETAGDRERQMQDAALEYARCMRENGVDMPDPQFRQGGMSMRSPKGVSPAKMRTADQACRKILEAVKPPEMSESEQKEFRAAALANARCMREHGLADFPDPGPDGLNVWITSPGPSGSNLVSGAIRGAGTDGSSAVIDLGDPTAKAAYDACKPILS